MAKPIQREAEIEGLNVEGGSTSLKDPDTMLGVTVLLLACLSLAVLAHAVM
ncbi:MAG TPA: hypothetical protein VFQ78_05940 [Candidatus Udaeobacter sp.]|jgi:hypothetical protein|nr:hypothetical protein [Candidatus Udaeobacter sp.]